MAYFLLFLFLWEEDSAAVRHRKNYYGLATVVCLELAGFCRTHIGLVFNIKFSKVVLDCQAFPDILFHMHKALVSRDHCPLRVKRQWCYWSNDERETSDGRLGNKIESLSNICLRWLQSPESFWSRIYELGSDYILRLQTQQKTSFLSSTKIRLKSRVQDKQKKNKTRKFTVSGRNSLKVNVHSWLVFLLLEPLFLVVKNKN